MPRNDGGALPGEEGGAPWEIRVGDDGRMMVLDVHGLPAAGYRLFGGMYQGGMLRWDPGYTAEAEQAAEHAFRRALTPQQAGTWAQGQWFTLKSDRGHWWRIRGSGISGNVDILSGEGGAPIAAYCAHPAGVMPYAACWLSQLLTLTCDEARFTRVAVCHYGYRLPDGFRVPRDLEGILPASVPWAYQ